MEIPAILDISTILEIPAILEISAILKIPALLVIPAILEIFAMQRLIEFVTDQLLEMQTHLKRVAHFLFLKAEKILNYFGGKSLFLFQYCLQYCHYLLP